MKVLIFLLLFLVIQVSAQDDKNVAKVTMLKGQAILKTKDGKSTDLKADAWVSQGDIIQTKDKSFVKLTFTDKSTMNVGPASEININKFGGGEAGLISVIKGQIRSQVTKDLLKQQQDKSKLIIKTKTAAMGIRGTDFLVSYSPETERTNLITFEGNVAMAQINAAEINLNDVPMLEMIVSDPNRAVAVTEGLYAGAAPTQEHVTIPTKISPIQYETLKENENLQTGPANQNTQTFNSVVPPGLSAKVVSNDQAVPAVSKPAEQLPPPEGQVDSKTGAQAPPAGGFVDLKTGIYVAPPPGAKFDANAGVFIVPTTHGSVDSSGNYNPPQGLKLNTDGNLIPTGDQPAPNQPGVQGQNNQKINPDAVMKIHGAGPNHKPGPQNDVLGGGFFVPGNYFIDNRDTSVNPDLNNPTETKVKVNIQTSP